MTPQEWLAAYWLYGLVFAAIGFFLAWLILARPARKRADLAEYNASDLQGKVRDADRAANEAQERERRLQSNLEVAKASQAEASNQLTSAQASFTEVSDKLAATEANLVETSAKLAAAEQLAEERGNELAELKLQVTSLRVSVQEAQRSFTNVLEPLQTKTAALTTENQNLKANLEGISGDLAAAKVEIGVLNETLGKKDTALVEAYARAVKLQRDLADQQGQFSSAQSELVALKRNVAALTAANRDLENRMQDARGEVANELAVLTSTMLRAKDEQLARANATVEGLYAQLNELKTVKPSAS